MFQVCDMKNKKCLSSKCPLWDSGRCDKVKTLSVPLERGGRWSMDICER